MLCFDKKDISNVENTLHQWILQNILKNQIFQRKIYIVDFYEMDFMKGTLILVKVDETYNIFKSAASHCLLVER